MSVFELSTLQKLRRIGLVRVNNLTDQAIQALGERHATLERIHLSYCDQISVMAIHFLLQKLPKLTHLSLTGIPAFRRAELQQFCRPPPSDFNTTQRAAFCVYSGKGVAELRDFLADLFASITNELATSNDTDYDDDFEDEAHDRYRSSRSRDPDPDILDEDDDDDEAGSDEVVSPEHGDLQSTPRLPERTPIPPEESSSRTFYPPISRELMRREK
uniref:Ubiquitin ligase complex F-box protein GRR1, putative n=1 Tax=Ganoderma boninense TaxID=34458 RepID=A0A5K1JUR8_9APHY|nr:Ubiquitin ligase complex F-box protein GRR1, putative [Ganoderma boninense]